VKDRAAPFSKKHRRYWVPVLGGMILIGVVNLAIGAYLYTHGPKDAPRASGDAQHWWDAPDAGVASDAVGPGR
jgi:hypothetical protein